MLIDASVLIAYFSLSDETHEIAVVLFDEFIQTGRNTAVVSPVTAIEIFIKPLRNSPQSAIHVHDFLKFWPNLAIAPIDLHVAQEAASLRAMHDFRLDDSLVVAAAVVGQAAHLITNDHEWHRKLTDLATGIDVTELRNFL